MNIIIDSMDMNFSKLKDIVEAKEARCAVVHRVTRVGHDLATEQQNTLLKDIFFQNIKYYICKIKFSEKSGTILHFFKSL